MFLFPHSSLLFCLMYFDFISQVTRVLSNNYPCYTSIPKVCGKCHVANIIICSTWDVHYNACHSKSKVHKSSFLWGSITKMDQYYWPLRENGLKKLCIWQFEFLNLAHLKQVQFLVTIFCGKFQLLPTFAFVGF